MTRNKVSVALAAGLAIVLLASAAPAAEGDWLFRAGASMVAPKDDNLELGPDTSLEVDDDVQFTFEIAYLFADHWGVELLAAAPFNHGLQLDSPSGRQPIGEVEHIPPTLSLQYHFIPEGRFRPYIGAGINYTIFDNVEPSELDLDDSIGFAAQLGADLFVTKNWFINAGVRWIDIDADAELTDNGTVVLDETVEIDPWVYSLNIGYRFGRPAPVVAAAPVAAAEPKPAPPPAPVAPPEPVDTDGDGVADDTDRCPDTPRGERTDRQGCGCDVTVQLQFALNSAELTPEDVARLEEITPRLKELTWVDAVVEGHTDSSGAAEYNQQLSERRAQSVVDFLTARGIGSSRFRAVGYGEAQPIADNSTQEGRAANRRVVIRRASCN